MDNQKQEKDFNSQNVRKYSGVIAPKGFLAAGIKAGFKSVANYDLGCIYSIKDAIGAAVFTTNHFQAAPVIISKNQLKKSEKIKLILANSGVANACTGEDGLKNTKIIIEKCANIFI